MATERAARFIDRELRERSLATLVESWAYLASGSPGAELVRADGAAIAAFVHAPDRQILNNAVLSTGLEDFGAALATIERTYGRHRIDQYAVWVHESERGTATALRAGRYAYDSSTRAMAMSLDGRPEVDTSALDLAEATLAEFWAVDGLEGLVPDLASEPAHFYLARFDGTAAAMLMAFDHERDCGIYMVGTRPAARRRGIATALSAHALNEARERGCSTASLQATAMAERVYAAVGFRDLGRFDEYVPE